jgi:photosystem II stability/assembly factor-like uncharacterized protein
MKNIILILFIILFSDRIVSQWSIQTSGTTNELTSAVFYNEMTGWICGYSGVILKTTNGGNNWFTVQSNVAGNLNSIFFTDNSTGWTCGASGKILKSTNGGLNWFSLTSGITYPIWSISFADKNSGVAVAWSSGPHGNDSSNILRTTNGGQNWVKLFSGNLARLNSVVYTGPLTGWAAGVLKIFKTSDGWNSWEQPLLDTNHYSSAFFINSNTGWVVGWNNNYYLTGIIKKTTNGGTNFVQQGNNITHCFRSVFFNNLNTGWIAGDSIVYKTANSGSSWISKPVPVQHRIFRCVYFVNLNTGWIVGSQGTILKTTSGGEIGIKQISNIIPNCFSLSQNYPNPFNPTTKIKFSIPPSRGARGVTNLTIYDVLGREIAALVNEQLSPGSYEAEWDGSNYPSGVYFYKLTTADYTETKKMILLK